MVKAEKALSIKDCIVPNWGSINNYDFHELGRSGFVGNWNHDAIEVKFCHSSHQVSHCEITMVKGQSFSASFIYVSNNGDTRSLLWSDLCNLKCLVCKKPWVLGSDFKLCKGLRGAGERFGVRNLLCLRMCFVKDFRS